MGADASPAGTRRDAARFHQPMVRRARKAHPWRNCGNIGATVWESRILPTIMKIDDDVTASAGKRYGDDADDLSGGRREEHPRPYNGLPHAGRLRRHGVRERRRPTESMRAEAPRPGHHRHHDAGNRWVEHLLDAAPLISRVAHHHRVGQGQPLRSRHGLDAWRRRLPGETVPAA